MSAIRFVMIGGFLGAGKTTTMARLARMYQARGQKVGVVTNDQAHDLVDTHNLRSQGLSVEEVPGACFCCRFDDLVGKMGSLQAESRPDVILAEPVGSCTDLVATVIQPLRDLYAAEFSIAPYAVLFKPSHGRKILGGMESGFSPKAAYIFSKQLEEADAIVLNRIDELPAVEVEELSALVARQHPGVPILRTSAKNGAGFGGLIEFLDQKGSFGRRILSIDYDTYAEGEAELGWLNCSVGIEAERSFDLDALLMEIIEGLAERTAGHGGEVAHLKIIGLTEGAYGVANLVSTRTKPELSFPSHATVMSVELIINARVAMDPETLRREVERRMEQSSRTRGARVVFRQAQSLRPGRPTPTHRYAEAVGAA